MPNTKEIFATEGKVAFLGQLSMAAYHLDQTRETVDTHKNNIKAFSEDSYQYTQNFITLLDSNDIPLPVTADSDFGGNGFESGIYTNENAAALVGRSSDALFLSFRGTNDNDGEAGLGLNNTPDESDWAGFFFSGKHTHFSRFKELILGISAYVNNSANGIKEIYVTGHSLGGAMVEAFMSKNWVQDLFDVVKINAVNFASPGYGALPGSDPRTTSFWIAGDKILIPTKVSDNIGDANKIFHNIEKDDWFFFRDEVHSMKLHSDFVDFFHDNGFGETHFRSLHATDYDRVYAFVEDFNGGVDPETGKYKIGWGDDTIDGSLYKEIIFGGEGQDTIKGKGGKDHSEGGAGIDTIFGGGGKDFIYGGAEGDTLHGGSKDDALYGNGGNDTIYGDGGDDKIRGGIGEDVLYGGDGEDQMWGGSETDYMLGQGDSDTIFGEGGDDRIAGQGSADTLYGGEGSDYLWGGGGADKLFGGTGEDYFLFRKDGSTDRIMDFQVDLDFIAVEGNINQYSVNHRSGETVLKFYDDGNYEYEVKLKGTFSSKEIGQRILPIDVDALLAQYEEYLG